MIAPVPVHCCSITYTNAKKFNLKSKVVLEFKPPKNTMYI